MAGPRVRNRGSGMTVRDQLIWTPGAARGTLHLANEMSTFEGWVAEVEEVAMAVLMEAGAADPHKPSTYPNGGFEKDSVEDYADRILWRLRHARAAIKKNAAAEAAWQALQLGVLVREADMKLEHEPTWLHGRKFQSEDKKNRRDALAKLIDEALHKIGRRAKARDVLEFIRNSGASAIQEIDEDDTIFWTNESGREKATSFVSLQNRVTVRRQNFSPR